MIHEPERILLAYQMPRRNYKEWQLECFYCGEHSWYRALRNSWNAAAQCYFYCCFITTLQGFPSSWWKQKGDERRKSQQSLPAHLANMVIFPCFSGCAFSALSHIIANDVPRTLLPKRKKKMEKSCWWFFCKASGKSVTSNSKSCILHDVCTMNRRFWVGRDILSHRTAYRRKALQNASWKCQFPVSSHVRSSVCSRLAFFWHETIVWLLTSAWLSEQKCFGNSETVFTCEKDNSSSFPARFRRHWHNSRPQLTPLPRYWFPPPIPLQRPAQRPLLAGSGVPLRAPRKCALRWAGPRPSFPVGGSRAAAALSWATL